MYRVRFRAVSVEIQQQHINGICRDHTCQYVHTQVRGLRGIICEQSWHQTVRMQENQQHKSIKQSAETTAPDALLKMAAPTAPSRIKDSSKLQVPIPLAYSHGVPLNPLQISKLARIARLYILQQGIAAISVKL
ncbi:hypothetical protein FGO68_gene1164 [Halteria grandinella]|uniref:Uncharacterized protein n=1 Tax=Halteria grandinella TaxID=5974 RepID=A0A8J8P978_HALGN|nr:hypothetical protein FGO68_gene1164 [Halteria grandinella]